MATISLTSESLMEASRKIEDAATRIDNAIQRLDAIMSDVDAVWSDQNSKQYLARYQELKEQNFPAFKAAAHNYSAFLVAVVNTYRKEFLEEVSTTVN